MESFLSGMLRGFRSVSRGNARNSEGVGMKHRIPTDRVRVLNSSVANPQGRYVLYAMRSAQRVEDNPALTLAVLRANEQAKPLVVAFCLTLDFPEANLRHFTFMLEGLAETFSSLKEIGAYPVLIEGRWPEEMAKLAEEACEVVLDQGYLRIHRRDTESLGARVKCRLFEVEGEAVVPIEVASEKAEYAARTVRPRIHRHLADFLHRVETPRATISGDHLELESLGSGLSDISEFLRGRKLDGEIRPVSRFFQGGPSKARDHLETFIEQRLKRYDDQRNQPQTDFTSNLSPYLHYGMLSPVHLALSVQEAAPPKDPQAESYIEELVVRRGLSQNFCHFTPNYDRWECLPEWARTTLSEHQGDPRPSSYTRTELETAQTHDPYWNAAQTEMVETGYMHNYMRMYWGKKILEWSATPQEAYETTLGLNNRYFLDGRDPVSFANVGWIFGLHDRPWQERPIYGKVRCMMASGLERKCDPQAYVEKIEKLTGRRVRGAGVGETGRLF